MTRPCLIDSAGKIDYGIYPTPISCVNYMDFDLRTPFGKRIPGWIKKVKFNQFHFIGISAADLMAGMAVVDLGYVTNGFFYVYDKRNKTFNETKKTGLPGKHACIEPYPETPHSRFNTGDLTIQITNSDVHARTKDMTLDATLNPSTTTPLRICTRSGYRGWTYTQKTSPVAISGTITIKGQPYTLDSPDAMATIDWTGGFMRRNTFWNWAAIATTMPDGRSLGLNLSCGTNETEFNENAFWVNGKKTETGPVHFRYDDDHFHTPWQVRSRNGKLDLTFYPETDRREEINGLVVASKFRQFLGTFEGQLKADDGDTINLDRCPGWAEDHYAKW